MAEDSPLCLGISLSQKSKSEGGKREGGSLEGLTRPVYLLLLHGMHGTIVYLQTAGEHSESVSGFLIAWCY